MLVKPYTLIVHPNSLHQIELDLNSICTFTTTVDAEGAKSYEVTQVHEADLTINQRHLLAAVLDARFIPMGYQPFPTEPLAADPVRSPVKPESHQNLQELRKFLRLDRRART